MANAIYPLYKNAMMQASANLKLDSGATATNPFLVMCSATYVYSAAHQFFSPSVTGVVGPASGGEITSPTVGVVAAGVFDGADVTYTAVSGSVVTQLLIYVANAGANTTWRLVLFEDTGVTGLPVTPNGGNITVTFNASGIMLL
jgi:hypothetical protein